jgi:hypothetical protein
MSEVAAPAPASQSSTTPGQPGATAQKAGEPSAQAEARRLKLRIGDKEEEYDEGEVVANFQKGKNTAQLMSKVEQRRQEALKEKAYADGVLSRIKSDPLGTLRELGVDVRGMSERAILDAIELEKMTPAERRAYDAEQKLKGYEDEKQKVKQEQEQAKYQEEVQRHADEFSNLFVSTMEKLGLPKTSGRHVLPRMARLYEQNETAGLQSDPDEMAAYVLEGLKKEHSGVLAGLEGDALLEHLGADTVKKVLAAHLGKVRARSGRPGATPAQSHGAPLVAKPAQGFDPRKGRMAEVERLINGG